MSKVKSWWAGLGPNVKYLIVALPISFLLCLAVWLPLYLFVYTDYTDTTTRGLIGLLLGVFAGLGGRAITVRILKMDD